MIQVVPLRIHKETSSDRDAYLKAKGSKFERVIKAGAPNRDAANDERSKREILRHLVLLAEAGVADFPLSPVEDPALMAKAQALKAEVDATFPMIEGETLMEEQVGLVGNKIYVKQVSNLATLYFTDATMALDPQGPAVAVSEQVAPVVGAAADNAQEEAEALQKVAKSVLDIGKGLVKVVPAPYGTVLSGAFEGLSAYLSLGSTSQAQQDTERMINRIAELVLKITWEANVKQTVKEQAGVVYAVIEGLNDHYAPLKKESKADDTHKELVDNYLTPWLLQLDVVLSTLAKDEDFAVASLPEYCLAAGAYLCILQELAVLDHDHQDDPFKSTRCTQIKNIKAPRFIDHVNTTYDKIVNRVRESVISTTEHIYTLRLFRLNINCPEHSVDGTGRHIYEGCDEIGAWYYDNSTFGSSPKGFNYCLRCGHDKWAWEASSKARDSWILGKQNELTARIDSELGFLKKLANEEWAKLKTYPLYGSDHMA